METDRELLELAAKAADISVTGVNKYGHLCTDIGCWNPLTDDGDALRLAVALGLEISTAHDGRLRVFAERKGVACCGEDWSTDSYAATRRAIVRCAAEIGRTK